MPNVQYMIPKQPSRGSAEQQLSMISTQEKQLRLQQVQQQKAQLLQMYAKALQQQALQQQYSSTIAAPTTMITTTDKCDAEHADPTTEPTSSQPASPAVPTQAAIATAAVRYYPAQLPNGMLVMVPGTMVVPQLQQQQQQYMPVVQPSSQALPKLKVATPATGISSAIANGSTKQQMPPGVAAYADKQQCSAKPAAAEPPAKRAKTAQGPARVRKVVQTYQDLLDDDDVTTEEEEDDTDDPVETPLSLPGLIAVAQACEPGTGVPSAGDAGNAAAMALAASVISSFATAAGAASTSKAENKAPVAASPAATTATQPADEDRRAAEILVELFNSSHASSCQEPHGEMQQRQWLPRSQQQHGLVVMQKPAFSASATMPQLTPTAAAIAAAAAAGLRAAAAKAKVQPTMEAAAIAVQEVVKNLLQQRLSLQRQQQQS